MKKESLYKKGDIATVDTNDDPCKEPCIHKGLIRGLFYDNNLKCQYYKVVGVDYWVAEHDILMVE